MNIIFNNIRSFCIKLNTFNTFLKTVLTFETKIAECVILISIKDEAVKSV